MSEEAKHEHDPHAWLKELLITQRKTIEQQLEDIHSKNNLIVHLQTEIERLTNEFLKKSASVVEQTSSTL